jgi:hypothetical protein
VIAKALARYISRLRTGYSIALVAVDYLAVMPFHLKLNLPQSLRLAVQP